MKDLPLVSVICLCHNHERFVGESIQSVLDQDYDNVELIVVNDGSADRSKHEIMKVIADKPIKYLDFEPSVGNCIAFNRGFRECTGQYIIDLAADDVLMSDRISAGLKTFNKQQIGVEYCNVLNINERGESIDVHFQRTDTKPQGDIYKDLVQRYFISPPSMMMERKVIEHLKGYDETLSYEDFDFWIRSSRHFHYGYTDNVLVKKRKVKNSLSAKQSHFRNKHQKSTLEVCKKIHQLNKTNQEKAAFRSRCFYEIIQCLKVGNFQLIPEYLRLL